MSQISDVVQVNITRETASVTQKGFGVPLVLGQHTRFSEKIKEYASLDEVALDFQTSDLEYKKAQALFSQQVKPEKIKIGKRLANQKQAVTLSISQVQNSTDYTVTINGTVFTATSGGSATAANIVDAIKAAVDAGDEPVTTTDNSNELDIEANTAGVGFSISVSSNLIVSTEQVNVSVVTELQDITQVDNDWYFLILTSSTLLDIKQVAEYIQTKQKLFSALSHDSNVKTLVKHAQTITLSADFVSSNVLSANVGGETISVTYATSHAATILALAEAIAELDDVESATVTGARVITVVAAIGGVALPITDIGITGGGSQATVTVATTADPVSDIASILKLNSYDRTFLVYTASSSNHVEAAWVGLNAPEAAGSITWNFKSLSGVTPESLTSTEKAVLASKNCNFFIEKAGINIMQNGVTSEGEFIDIMQGTDYIQARLEENVFGTLASEKKVSFTNQGIDVVKSLVKQVLLQAVDQRILASSPAPTVTAPDISAISSGDKSDRILRNVKFSATYAGAIHKTILNGNLSV